MYAPSWLMSTLLDAGCKSLLPQLRSCRYQENNDESYSRSATLSRSDQNWERKNGSRENMFEFTEERWLEILVRDIVSSTVSGITLSTKSRAIMVALHGYESQSNDSSDFLFAMLQGGNARTSYLLSLESPKGFCACSCVLRPLFFTRGLVAPRKLPLFCRNARLWNTPKLVWCRVWMAE